MQYEKASLRRCFFDAIFLERTVIPIGILNGLFPPHVPVKYNHFMISPPLEKPFVLFIYFVTFFDFYWFFTSNTILIIVNMQGFLPLMLSIINVILRNSIPSKSSFPICHFHSLHATHPFTKIEEYSSEPLFVKGKLHFREVNAVISARICPPGSISSRIPGAFRIVLPHASHNIVDQNERIFRTVKNTRLNIL